MVLCAAYNCNVRSGESVPMFLFPKERKRCKVWVDKLKLENYWPSKYSKLCVKHFANDQFKMDVEQAKAAGYKKIELKEDAVPSIFDFSCKKRKNEETPQPNSQPKVRRSSKSVLKRQALRCLQKLDECILANESVTSQRTDENPQIDGSMAAPVDQHFGAHNEMDLNPPNKFDIFTQTTGLITIQTLWCFIYISTLLFK